MSDILTIKDAPGKIAVAEMRQLFERAIKDTPALKDHTPLGAMEINEQFSHYMDSDTDTMWLGFALGMRCAERVARATQQSWGGNDMETAIDLFAGLGGNSEGARAAGVRVVWAENHWQPAVDTHAENHPEAIHVCQDLHQANWLEVPRSDIVIASPACTGHAHARGKDRPHHDAARSTAWAVVSAVECHRPRAFLVENVKEFLSWALYPAWCAALNALGYAVSPHIWDAADCGVPQHRVRTLIAGTKSKHPVELAAPATSHRIAREIINFDLGNWSQIDRPGRSPKTLARVSAGRRQYGDRFVMPYYGSGSGLTGRSLDRPLGAITTRARWAVVDGDSMRMLTKAENVAGMGFPAGYRVPENDALALHMLGNANPPPLAKHAIEQIRKVS